MLRSLSRWLLIAATAVSLAGCYGVKSEVISADRAEVVPGLEGRYQSADGESTDVVAISAVAGSNDYLMISEGEASTPEDAVTLRAYKLNDRLYVVQMWNPLLPEEGIIVAFMAIDDSGISLAVPTNGGAALAAKYGVTLSEDGVAVDGAPDAVTAFIAAHKDEPFNPAEPLFKRI